MIERDARNRGFRFPAAARLQHKGEFERVFSRGLREINDLISVWAAPNGLEHCRLGLVVGRRHGPAVTRNRLKRVLREAFRLSQADLPSGLDLLCSPRPRVALPLSRAIESLQRLTRRLAARLASA